MILWYCLRNIISKLRLSPSYFECDTNSVSTFNVGESKGDDKIGSSTTIVHYDIVPEEGL
jgi:hypothetical protein